MNCPKCQQQMTHASVGWLCINCGYIAPQTPVTATTDLPVATEPVGRARVDVAAPSPSVVTPTNTDGQIPNAPSIRSVNEQVQPFPVAATAAEPLLADKAPTTSVVVNGVVQPLNPLLRSPQDITGAAVTMPPVQSSPLVGPQAELLAPAARIQPQPTSQMTTNVMPEAYIAPKPRRSHKALFLVTGVAFLLVGLVSLTAYAEVSFMPENALLAYILQLRQAKTGHFTASITYNSSDAMAANFPVSLDASGQYDVTRVTNPRFQTRVAGLIADGAVSADLVLLENSLFFRVSSFDFLKKQGLAIPIDWYKYNLPQQIAADHTVCSDIGSNKTLMAKLAQMKLPLKQVKLAGLIESVDGHIASHYSATLDQTKLQAYLDDVDKLLPEPCRLHATSKIYSSQEVSYDIWRAIGFDRLEIHVKDRASKAQVELSLATSQYNRAVSIDAPANAKDFSELLKSLYGPSAQLPAN